MFRRLSFGLLLLLSSIAFSASSVELNPNHPMQHVVVKGDTLWDISGRFLQHPWEWPKIWHANSQIKNPHLIYPGDIISLVYRDGQPMLELSRGPTNVKLSPKVRVIQLGDAISTIPFDAISPFLTRPQVVGEEVLKTAPYIVATADERVLAGEGDLVYVRGLGDEALENYSVFRAGKTYVDPDTKEVLGYEAIYGGEGLVLENGDPATLELKDTTHEVLMGDRLLPIDPSGYEANFFPKTLKNGLTGHVISVFGGVSLVGQYQIIVLDRGIRNGVDVGHLLSLYQAGETIRDLVTEDPKDMVTLPDEYAGVAMVFKIFDKVSYAIVMEAEKALQVGDKVKALN